MKMAHMKHKIILKRWIIIRHIPCSTCKIQWIDKPNKSKYQWSIPHLMHTSQSISKFLSFFANVTHSLTLSIFISIFVFSQFWQLHQLQHPKESVHIQYDFYMLPSVMVSGIKKLSKMRNSFLISKLLPIIQADKKKSMLTNISLLIQKISPEKFWVLVSNYPLKVIITFNWDTNIHNEQLIFSYTHCSTLTSFCWKMTQNIHWFDNPKKEDHELITKLSTINKILL